MQLASDEKRSPWRCSRRGRVIGLIFLLVAGSTFLFGMVILPNYLLQECGCGPETNAIASLKMYATAQAVYRKAKYENGLYASDVQTLADKTLVPQVMASASGPGATGEYQGYRFAVMPISNGKAIDRSQEMFGLCAWPAIYERTGINTYVIRQDGTVRMKDNGGKPVRDVGLIDETWMVP